jgi:hypothetical protein
MSVCSSCSYCKNYNQRGGYGDFYHNTCQKCSKRTSCLEDEGTGICTSCTMHDINHWILIVKRQHESDKRMLEGAPKMKRDEIITSLMQLDHASYYNYRQHKVDELRKMLTSRLTERIAQYNVDSGLSVATYKMKTHLWEHYDEPASQSSESEDSLQKSAQNLLKTGRPDTSGDTASDTPSDSTYEFEMVGNKVVRKLPVMDIK